MKGIEDNVRRALDVAELDVGLDALPFPGRTAHRDRYIRRACADPEAGARPRPAGLTVKQPSVASEGRCVKSAAVSSVDPTDVPAVVGATERVGVECLLRPHDPMLAWPH
jgi:hypothetical protein